MNSRSSTAANISVSCATAATSLRCTNPSTRSAVAAALWKAGAWCATNSRTACHRRGAGAVTEWHHQRTDGLAGARCAACTLICGAGCLETRTSRTAFHRSRHGGREAGLGSAQIGEWRRMRGICSEESRESIVWVAVNFLEKKLKVMIF